MTKEEHTSYSTSTDNVTATNETSLTNSLDAPPPTDDISGDYFEENPDDP